MNNLVNAKERRLEEKEKRKEGKEERSCFSKP